MRISGETSVKEMILHDWASAVFGYDYVEALGNAIGDAWVNKVIFGRTGYVEMNVDGVGLVGWVTDSGFVPAWCNWEWEDNRPVQTARGMM